eukprot:9288914-Ditylum_brightwellii.AAC.1
MSGDIPMIRTTFSIIVMKHPQAFLTLFPSIMKFKIPHLRMTDKYFELLDHINQVVQFINENGGWTVVGWYKQCVINNHALVGNNGSATGNSNNNSNGDEVHVDNGEINHHVVEVLARN